MSRPQVLIVGAGPTGLVLALWLARVGTRFRLIDKNSGPGLASRAMAVQARTLEFYRQLGIADEVVAAGFRLNRIHIRNRAREIAVANLGDVGGGISPFPFVLSLPQDDHERLLTARLHAAGHAVEWDTELTAFTQSDDGVSATLRKPGGEEAWAGAYLCGCDGAAQRRPARAGRRLPGRGVRPAVLRRRRRGGGAVVRPGLHRLHRRADLLPGLPGPGAGDVPVHRRRARGPPGPC